MCDGIDRVAFDEELQGEFRGVWCVVRDRSGRRRCGVCCVVVVVVVGWWCEGIAQT